MKKAMKMLSLVLAIAMLFGCLTACASKTTTSETTTTTTDTTDTASTDTSSSDTAADTSSDAASSEGGEIVIALISNTTGDYAQYGQPVRDGAMLYINQLNANGGINGKQVKVLEYDDKGDGVEAVNAYNLAKENGITAVVGSVLTGATIGLADATNEDNMPQITASATATGVTVMEDTGEVRENVFRACFIDPFQGQKMADYAVEKLGAKTAAIFYETGSDYSEGLKNAFVVEAERMGLEIVDTEAFATGDKDFKAQMTNIASKNPDIVFCPIYYGEAGLAIQAARQAGCTATFLGGDGFGSVKDYASAEELEGSVYCSGYAPGTEDVAQFEKDYCETFDVEEVPNMFAPLAYDASMIMAYGLKAAEDAGLTAGTDEYKQAVIDAIKTMDGVKGITGSYSFDSDNNPIKSVAIIELSGGEEVFKEMY